MAKIAYRVASVSKDEAPVIAQVAGQNVEAKVPCLTVEMVSADGGMGHTFRFTQFTEEDEQSFLTARDEESLVELDFNFPAA